MTQAVAVQGGIRPWMFFVGLAVVSLVILFSTGRLDGLRPMSSSEKSSLAYARAQAHANDPSLAWAGANEKEHERWTQEVNRLQR